MTTNTNTDTARTTRTDAPAGLEAKIQAAAERLLEHKGCRVLDARFTDSRGTEMGVIALDPAEGCLVFAAVALAAEDGFEDFDREAWRPLAEACAAEWLAGDKTPAGEFKVRFDLIGFLPVGENRALARHCINVLV